MDPKDPLDRLGGYRVLRRIATGGTSDVLLAKAEGPLGFERQVVLKLLLSQYRDDAQFARMFAREAAAYARLSHPSIVRLFDFFSQNDQLVMVLEFVDGLPLNRLRAGLKDVGRKLTDFSALYVADRVFDAIACAHGCIDENGAVSPVIHRDVNPSNVLVAWNGEVKLADFGIARVTGVRSETQSGLIKGTFGYMAPEQVNGGTIGPHTDVYAAGVLLWEMLAHRKAIQRGALPEIEILRAMAEPKIVSLDILRPDLDRRLREVVQATLEPDPVKRTITAEQVVRTLRDIAPAGAGRGELHELLKVAKDRDKRKKKLLSIPPAGDSEADVVAGAPLGVLPPAAAVPKPKAAPRPGEDDETDADATNENLDVDRLFDGLSLPEDDASSPLVGASSVSPSTVPNERAGKQDAVVRGAAKSSVPPPLPAQAETKAPRKVEPQKTQPIQRPSLEGLPTDARATVAVPMPAKPASVRPGAAGKKPESVRPPPLPAKAEKKPDLARPPTPPQALASTVVSPHPAKGGTAPMAVSAPRSAGKVPAAPAVSAKGDMATELAQEIAARFGADAAATQADTTVSRPAPSDDRVPLPSATTTLMMGGADTERPPPPALDRTLALDSAPPRPPEGARPPAPAPTPTPPPVPAFPRTPSGAIVPPGAPPRPPGIAPLPPPPASPGIAPLPPPPQVPQGFAPPPGLAERATRTTAPPAPRSGVGGKIAAVLVVALLSAGGGVAYVQRARIMASFGKGPEVPTALPSASAPPSASASAPSASAARPPEDAIAIVPPAADAAAPSDAGSNDAGTKTLADAAPAPSDAAVAAEGGASTNAASGRTAKANTTILNTALAAPGHRIFVDGRAVAETPAAVEVGCGKHEIKLGSAGTPRTIDLPCGQELTIGDR